MTAAPETRLLAETARDLLARRAPEDFDEGLWRELVELGWTGASRPELGVLLEEIGRAAVTSPLGETVAARELVASLGTTDAADELVARIEAGDVRAAVAPTGGRAPLVVPWAPFADAIVRVVRSGDAYALACVDPRGAVEPATAFDFTPVGVVALDDARAEVLAPRVEPDALAHAQALVGALRCAELVGLARWMTDATVEYVKVREQFGRPLGQFQAVQHMCANMAMELDGAALLVSEALARDAVVAAAAALVFAPRACERIALTASQLHGGVGFMTEFPLHRYYRRAKALRLRLGAEQDVLALASRFLLDPERRLVPFPEIG